MAVVSWQARVREGGPHPAAPWKLRKAHLEVFREQLEGLSWAAPPGGSFPSCPSEGRTMEWDSGTAQVLPQLSCSPCWSLPPMG